VDVVLGCVEIVDALLPCSFHKFLDERLENLKSHGKKMWSCETIPLLNFKFPEKDNRLIGESEPQISAPLLECKKDISDTVRRTTEAKGRDLESRAAKLTESLHIFRNK
jgi:hypothetical protein